MLTTMKDRLKAIQSREGWTDAQMAKRLHVARTTWTEIKNDRIPLSERVQLLAARAFPELLGALVTSVSMSGHDADAQSGTARRFTGIAAEKAS